MTTINLKRLMKERGIGNKALSEKASIPIGTLNKIIYGETTNPSLDTLTALSKALNCTLDELLTDISTNPEVLSGKEEELLGYFRELNDEGQYLAIQTLRSYVRSGEYIKNNEFGVLQEKEA